MRGESRGSVGTLARVFGQGCVLISVVTGSGEPRALADDVAYRATSNYVPAPPPEPRCPVSAADPDGDCDAGKAGEEDDNPIMCSTTTAVINVCGRSEAVTRSNCENAAVTALMEREAPLHPELRDEYVRMNTCVSLSGSCTPEDDTVGNSGLNDQVAGYVQGVVDAQARAEFHFSVTRSPLEQQRTDLAQVFHKGYRRKALSQHLMFRTHDDKLFNDDAEGVDLVTKAMSDRERAEQLKLAEVLTAVSAKFEAMGEDESADFTAMYAKIAQSRALELEGYSCELETMAKTNHVRQENMKPIGNLVFFGGTDTSTTGTTSTATDTSSDVTGADGNPPDFDSDHGIIVGDRYSTDPRFARNPATATATATATSTATSTATGTSSLGGELENLFGPDPARIAEAARLARGLAGDDESLFVRVHREYRKLDALGRFPKSLLDGPP